MKNDPRKKMTTQTLAYSALLAALSIVLARVAGLMPNASTRFSIEAVPMVLAGMFFGPLTGGLVGFAADFVGCLLSPYGYNPIFCVPPILYGVFGGLFRWLLSSRMSFLRLIVALLPPIVLGSVLYQSASLAYIYYDGSFAEGFAFYLGTRSVQFLITLFADSTVMLLLFRSRVFERMNIWPLKKKTPDKDPVTV